MPERFSRNLFDLTSGEKSIVLSLIFFNSWPIEMLSRDLICEMWAEPCWISAWVYSVSFNGKSEMFKTRLRRACVAKLNPRIWLEKKRFLICSSTGSADHFRVIDIGLHWYRRQNPRIGLLFLYKKYQKMEKSKKKRKKKKKNWKIENNEKKKKKKQDKIERAFWESSDPRKISDR